MPAKRPAHLLTTGGAAAALGLSQDTVARMADDGILLCVLTRGGHRRISVAAVEAHRRGERLRSEGPM